MKLGPVTLAQPGARMGGRRVQLGQENMLTVQVNRDGVAAPGVPVQIVFQDDSMEEGVTDPSGAFNFTYGPELYGQTAIQITPPAGVREMEDAGFQLADLQGGPVDVLFEMLSTKEAPKKSRDIVTALAATAILVFVGVQAS
jgi:hypothetical protein